MPHVVLVGPPGAGKSTIARRLANTTALPWVDSDTILEEMTGMSVPDFYQEVGEEGFREKEVEAVQKALESHGIVSLGGGAVITEENRQAIMKYPVVWLHVGWEEGVRRTQEEGDRPILHSDNPEERYKNIIETRLPFYQEVSSYKVQTDERTPQQIVAAILAYLENEN